MARRGMARSNRTKSRRGHRDRQTERETAARFHSATPHSLFHFRAEPLLSVLTRPTNPPTNFAFLLAPREWRRSGQRPAEGGTTRAGAAPCRGLGISPHHFQSGPISSFFARQRRCLVFYCARAPAPSQFHTLTPSCLNVHTCTCNWLL